MPTLTIDGRTVKAREGAFLLEAIRQAGIDVPTLCDSPAVEPFGGCRMCVVDVTRKEWDGWCKLVASCLYPVEEGLIVLTRSERVVETRRTVIDLLLARCPDTPLVRKIAADHGVHQTSYVRNPEPADCILCGLCTRACDAVGAKAISSVDRGIGREIAPPFKEPPPDCIGCLACANICPTQCIPFVDGARTRTIWNREFPMLRCPACGRAHITESMAAFFDGRNGIKRAWFEECDTCKRKRHATTVAALSRS